ncbi:MAG: GDSL-like Lipase/Acylhydrolase [Acidobacteria bacterium]|jgi:lysophospholipase L1-like esterase|nr:GDSL-like Lipase/Acylhydrolase [Acidobacteriota bacterium]
MTDLRPTSRRVLLGALIAAALAGACSKSDSPLAPSPPPTPGSTVVYAAVGASDAAGVGSSAPCVPFTDCPNGMGYVPRIVRDLQGQGSTVTLSNLGIPAAVISPRMQALGEQYGRTIPGNFIDQEMPFVPRNSTLVTIFAGANDVNTISAAIGGGAAGSNPSGYVDQQITAFGVDFHTLLDGVRSRAPSARIVVANLPNMGAMPFSSKYSVQRRRLLQKASVGFSTQVINRLASEGIPVVDILCDSRYTSRSYLSSDGFHPNDAGYAALAADFLRAIRSGGYPAPSSSCRFMTTVK